MKLRALVLGGLAGGLAAILAHAAPLPKEPLATRAAPVWVVDAAASRLTFRGSVGGQTFDGVFKKWDAEIAFDPQNLRTSHAVVSVATASAVTGDPNRDQLLPSDDWFAARRFPLASFSTSSITPAGPSRYLAAGVLRIKGFARRISFPVTVALAKDRAVLTSVITLSRRDFGVGQGRSASPEVADQVSVLVRLSARRSK